MLSVNTFDVRIERIQLGLFPGFRIDPQDFIQLILPPGGGFQPSACVFPIMAPVYVFHSLAIHDHCILTQHISQGLSSFICYNGGSAFSLCGFPYEQGLHLGGNPICF